MSIKALFYKAFRINLRHYVQSTFQICFPLIPVILIICFGSNTDPSSSSWNQTTIVYPTQTKEEIMTPVNYNLSIVYYPDNPFTQRIMKGAKAVLKNGNFKPVNEEADIEKWFINKTSKRMDEIYGVIFEMDKSSSTAPKHLKYTLRGIKKHLPDTDLLFPLLPLPGPNEAGAPYFHSEFIRLKVAIDDSFLQEVGIPTPPNWTMTEYPYPEHKRSGAGSNELNNALPIMLAGFFMYAFSHLAAFSITEKKSGITERLKMVGLNEWMILLYYLIHCFLIYVISITILTILFKIGNDGPAILSNSNPIIIWILLFLFCLQSSSFFVAASSLFNHPSLAASLIVLAYFASCAPVYTSPSISTVGQVFTSLMPLLYFYWAFQVINGFEASGVGATFSTLLKMPTSGKCDIPLLPLMLLSLLGTTIFCLLYIYISNVKPGPYGYAKPWYYIFPIIKTNNYFDVEKNDILELQKLLPEKPVFDSNEGAELDYADDLNNLNLFSGCDSFSSSKKYFCKVNPSKILKNEDEMDDSSRGLYEKVPDNVEVGLQISNLSKRFGNVKSVKDVSLNIYVGQITALLGHNGAGKTTTLSMITGMYKPSSGTILYKGYNIFSNLKAFRLDLGLCPQEDMLISGISVWEHLMIFGMIKQLNSNELTASANDALEQVGLSQKKNTLVSELSGGMKRKLCLALSLLGNPKVLVLDEPSSGLDPESRREIWNILLTFRENRIMIITTHFMEEADALGDQIAIMDHGLIKCYGTPMFLKKHYGAGYQITCCSDPSKFDDIASCISTMIPSSTLMNRNDDKIVFNIPSSNCGLFPKLFKELESNEKLEIKHIGINCTTMDDVFLKVREEADKGSYSKNNSMSENLITEVPNVSMRSTNPIKKFSQQFFALVCKNIMYMRGKWFIVLIMGVIVPMLGAYWAMDSTTTIFNSQSNSSISFDLKIYDKTDVLLDGSMTPEIMNSFSKLIREEGSNVVDVKKTLGSSNIIDGLLKYATEDELKFRQSCIVAGNFNGTVPNILFSSVALHAPVIAINLLYNSFLRASGFENKITTKSYPLTFTSATCDDEYGLMQTFIFIYWVIWTFVVCAFIGNTFIRAPHAERMSLLKHLELMTGVSYVTYWLSFFLWDFIVYCISTALMFILFMSLDSIGLLSIDNSAGVLALIIILYGVSGIWMVYCFTFIFKIYSESFNLFYVLNLLLGCASLIFYNLIPPFSKWFFVTQILRFIPISPFLISMQLFIFKAVTKIQCKICPNAYSMPACANIDGSFFDSEMNLQLYYLGFDWIIYFIIIMLIEFGFFSKILDIINSYRVGLIEISSLTQVETDVAKERDRVDAALNSDTAPASIVIVDGLGKKYARNITAVYDVSFASKEGECFGLLGVNGAGKTTTFNILSGITKPTQGRALIKGHDLNNEKKLCLSYMGYCPQFSALGEGLTGKQMLTLFANLRLAQPNHIKKLVDKWIDLLGLEEYADRICETYSGGNKRKLSTAMAFINNPSVILLDEPTSGVDPVTRRNLWTVLKESQNNKQTIIISSHSMDECEAVCDRLTIMVNGFMKCIGNTQHLKSLYGDGFIILIKLRDSNDDQRDSLKSTMSGEFGSKLSLKDEHVMLLHYLFDDPTCHLSTLFRSMEKIKEKFQIIDEYTISDASLEHIFLSFAKKKDN